MIVDGKISLIQFVYPFLFDGQTLEQRREAVEKAQWRGRQGSLVIWRKGRFPKEDLLAHVERYLNPPENTAPTALLWTMDNNALQSPSGLGGNADWFLTLPQKEIPFQLTDVQLSLFRVGVGFLTFSAKPKSQEIADWLDFLHSFRFIRGQRGVGLRMERRTGIDQISPFFPQPAGGLEKHPGGKGNFAEIVNAILNTTAIEGDTKGADWWQEVFVPGQLIPFATLYVDGQDISEEAISELLYRVRNFFPSERVIQPAPDDLRFDHPSLLAYAERMWFVFSLEGGAFVAINAPETDFFRRELPSHLRNEYFLLFLLTLHQRFALMSLSQQVSEHWLRGDEGERAKAFERIRDTLLEFTARGYFSQAMQREHHHRVYQRWQEIFQLERLYQEVSDEVREMHEFLQMRQSKKLEERLNFLTFVIGIPALLFGFLSINLYRITAKEEGLSIWWALSLTVIAFVIGLIWWRMLRR
ncbi:hypothetical protein Q2T83_01145 [Fervidibacter sacchari]|uniref:Magnesium transporter CorA n=1 Tax=Candidatus Fervidibacter sacchari TaxID=1448929 RepID=A0ABT2EWB1_9BACT|nr:hypothetical protein [Candidatus Fervidibacter sacchari]MCS3921208.1 hypothetical protein [Candidatus Fervidibacter sacchari]WKU16454.1 hypothetical protein Q2T83_01145 [Candidatus Fervidibacter sacchari]